MAQHAKFWTYRAGSRVLTSDGRQVGRVAAVRRDAILVTRADGTSAWLDAGLIEGYDGAALTVRSWSFVGVEPSTPDAHVDRAQVERVLLSASHGSFDA